VFQKILISIWADCLGLAVFTGLLLLFNVQKIEVETAFVFKASLALLVIVSVISIMVIAATSPKM